MLLLLCFCFATDGNLGSPILQEEETAESLDRFKAAFEHWPTYVTRLELTLEE